VTAIKTDLFAEQTGTDTEPDFFFGHSDSLDDIYADLESLAAPDVFADI
jgi:hypothetical protein